MASAAVIGTGLIGASIGMALRHEGWQVVGWDPEPDALSMALERGAVDDAGNSPDGAAENTDLVFLAGPLHANLATLGSLDTNALVTDTTSVKSPFSSVPSPRFIGGHPMAGREHAGPSAASPALFRGAAWVLCPNGGSEADLDYLLDVVTSVGANPVVMSAERHDEIVAFVSHLPHLLANALVNVVADDPDAGELVSGSFRDLTRVASAESAWWPEVLASNSQPIGEALDRLIAELVSLRALAASGEVEELERQLSAARDRRRSMAPPVAIVRVILQDRPGEIAAVGHALETSKVDVRDLQLRHALHGGGGILTLSVRPGEQEALREALAQEGFETEQTARP
jgi:prephenate dehydrogenase